MWRLFSIFVSISVAFALVVARLFFVQIIQGGYYKEQANLQHYNELIIPAQRGEILSSDGSPLVMNQPSYLVYAQPPLIQGTEDFSRTVAPVLGLEPAEVEASLSQPGRAWVPLAHKVAPETYSRLKQLDLAGLGFEKEPVRFYPEASMAAQLLGFVASDENGRQKGYFGIEGYYDRELRGSDGTLRQEKDVNGAPIVIGNLTRIDAENGRSLVLYIDRTVQRIVEDHLKEGLKKYGAKDGNVVVMDPKTGGIIAMASLPKYDPGAYQEYDKSLFLNPVVASSYEPGSTFKVLVMSAGIEEHAVTPDTIMQENGPVRIGEYLIRTWNDTYNGAITMTDVLVHSSNVGMVFVGNKLGKDKLLSYIHKFGFGQPTGVDLQDESSPDIRPDNEWYDIDLATATFGQGIAVTPLQMVRAVAAIANGGKLMKPQIVKEIKDAHGKVIRIKPEEIRRVISPQTAQVITEMMIQAVDRGEAKWAKPKGYRIAGKTGTAQIPVAGHYDDKKTIASFVGFAPADNPKFVILVTLREPTASPWGSETAAPMFFQITKDLFTYYGITP